MMWPSVSRSWTWTQNVTGAMEAIRILDKKENLNQDYDEEADVPYISIGEPQNALGVDIGEGAIVRYIAPTGSNVNAVYSVSKHAGERVAQWATVSVSRKPGRDSSH